MSQLPEQLTPHLLPDSVTLSASGTLHIAGYAFSELAKQYGTPLYIFDCATIVNACRHYKDAFARYYSASTVQMLYASKAYLSPHIARIVADEGMGLDVVSGGELMVAQRAGVPMERIAFHGNNKSEEELRLALRLGVGRIVLDNWSEIERLSRLARELNIKPRVLLRVAPDVDADTHRYLQTGHAASKFGFHLGNREAYQSVVRILQDGILDIVGLHAHSGTMLKEARPYQQTLERLLLLADELYREVGWWPQEISPGGGWAVNTPGETLTPGIEILAQALQQTMTETLFVADRPLPTLIIEPGRSIIARAGVALYQVGARKATSGGVTYLFIDGGMADNIRPALYGALYTALPIELAEQSQYEEVRIAGRYCESGDILIEQVMVPYMQEGDFLLIPNSGAYCLPMASNYNHVPRPAVILVDEQRVQIIERRETYEDLLARYPVIE